MHAGPRYKAFISYSHEDRRWAVWLQHKLEHYRLPPKVAAANALPRRALHPIFRDEDELAASTDLSQKIREALEASENLIVVCSPNAVASHWVNQEIKAFQASGRAERIFSLVVAGNPDSDNQNCFPDQLVQHGTSEPLAADVRPRRQG